MRICGRHILAGQPDLLLILHRPKRGIQLQRGRGMPRDIVRLKPKLLPGQGDQSVQRPAVEQMPAAAAAATHAADRALAGAGGPIDGDDRDHLSKASGPLMRMPTLLRQFHEPGERGGDIGHIQDPDRRAGLEAGDREGHGDAVIAMTVDGAAAETLAAADADAIGQQRMLDAQGRSGPRP